MPDSTATPHYGFYDRLKAEFPSQIVVDVTEVCNLACVHCPHPTFKKSSFYAARYQSPDLNAKLIEEVRTQGRGYTQYIRYTGEGEPLIHPHIFEMLRSAKQHSGVLVSLTTNGTLLNEKRIASLIETGIDIVDISLDAHSPETYARVRVNGDLTLTRTNVLNLLRSVRDSASHLKVVVSYVEQPQNQHETTAFESFWKANGADYVVIRRLHSAAGAVAQVADALRGELPDVPRRACLYPWERIILNPRGELTYCPQDWVHGSVVADYRATTIKEVWQS